MTRLTRISALALVVSAGWALPAHASAASDAAIQQELAAMRAQMAQMASRIDSLEGELGDARAKAAAAQAKANAASAAVAAMPAADAPPPQPSPPPKSPGTARPSWPPRTAGRSSRAGACRSIRQGSMRPQASPGAPTGAWASPPNSAAPIWASTAPCPAASATASRRISPTAASISPISI